MTQQQSKSADPSIPLIWRISDFPFWTDQIISRNRSTRKKTSFSLSTYHQSSVFPCSSYFQEVIGWKSTYHLLYHLSPANYITYNLYLPENIQVNQMFLAYKHFVQMLVTKCSPYWNRVFHIGKQSVLYSETKCFNV